MNSQPVPAETCELTLSGMAYGGEAFGRDAHGRMIFVPFACPGERVGVRIIESHKRWARAELLQVSEPSDERIQARCAHFGDCGGCQYQHLRYSAQLESKREIVSDQLRRIGGMTDPPVSEVIPSPSPWHSRNRMGFRLTPAGQIGLVGRKPETVVQLSECFLPCPAIGEVWPKLDFEAGTAVERVAIRAGNPDQVLIVLQGGIESEITVELPVNVVWTQPDGIRIVAGEGHLEHQVGDARFRVSASSFFQVNTALIPSLVEHTLQVLDPGPGRTVFDLYAGVGLFSYFLSAGGASIVAVEESPVACGDFEINLREQDQVELYQASVEAVLPELEHKPDAVVLDPPRSGLDLVVVEQLIRLKPRAMAYISCDPATFARDARRLATGGFKLERVIPFDLFPQTFHIEVLSHWTNQ